MSGWSKQLSRSRVPAILQDGAHHHNFIETDGYLFIFNTRERLKSFLTFLLVRYLGFHLTRNGCCWEPQASGHTAWILTLASCALYTHCKLSSLCWELTSYRFGSYLERNNQVKDTTSLSAPVLLVHPKSQTAKLTSRCQSLAPPAQRGRLEPDELTAGSN